MLKIRPEDKRINVGKGMEMRNSYAANDEKKQRKRYLQVGFSKGISLQRASAHLLPRWQSFPAPVWPFAGEAN